MTLRPVIRALVVPVLGLTLKTAPPVAARPACTRCGRPLRPADAVLLDLNLNTHRYRREPWPPAESQGGFWFGRACARRQLEGQS